MLRWIEGSGLLEERTGNVAFHFGYQTRRIARRDDGLVEGAVVTELFSD